VRLSAGKAILYGTLVVGILDGLDAIIFFWLRSGATPVRIFQGIASGVLGRTASVQGGVATALLGVLLHFVIAFGVVTTFYLVSRRARILTRHPVVSGILYGLAVYVVMNYVVIPMSAIGPRTAAIPLAVHVNGLLIHAFGVGLPSALVARSAER
jgi:uncharacterized membrane protein YagU involved in acid resistance